MLEPWTARSVPRLSGIVDSTNRVFFCFKLLVACLWVELFDDAQIESTRLSPLMYWWCTHFNGTLAWQTATVSFVSARISSCCKNTSLAGSIRGSKKLCMLKVLFQQEGSCYKVCPAGENSGICSWTWLAEVERSESWRIKDMFWDTCFLLNKNYHSVTPLPFTKTFSFHILCNIQLISLMCHQTCGCRMDEGTPRFQDLRK